MRYACPGEVASLVKAVGVDDSPGRHSDGANALFTRACRAKGRTKSDTTGHGEASCTDSNGLGTGAFPVLRARSEHVRIFVGSVQRAARRLRRIIFTKNARVEVRAAANARFRKATGGTTI
jgi:hypothetical protein